MYICDSHCYEDYTQMQRFRECMNGKNDREKKQLHWKIVFIRISKTVKKVSLYILHIQ